MDEVIHLPNSLIDSSVLARIEEAIGSYKIYGEMPLSEYHRVRQDVTEKGIPSLLPKRHYKQENLRDNAYYVGDKYLEECLNKSYPRTITCEHNHLYKIAGNTDFIDIQDSLYSKFGSGVRISCSATFLYPDTEGFMGWHTNNTEGTNPLRIYVVYAKEGGISFFRYINKKGHMVTDYDKQGWNIRAFQPGNHTSSFWHCVYSGNTTRISYGYKVNNLKLDDLKDIGSIGSNIVVDQIDADISKGPEYINHVDIQASRKTSIPRKVG